MSEPPGLPSALGIESVETIPEGGNLTVRVTGRWRRRRPEWRGPAILVVEAQGTRYRFPAMPEPPSVTGTMPGTWRMTFSVARELGPHLAGRSWLQLGTLIAPLPVFAESKVGGAPEETAPVGDEPQSEPEPPPPVRRPPGELAIDTARRRADEAEALAAELALRVDQLERALEEARAHPARLERARRAAEQSAHAEAARRAELEEQLADQERALEDARARAAALARRVEELEQELRRLRRTADEAVHLAAGERAARERAERLAQERPAPQPQPVQVDVVAERLREERTRTLKAEETAARSAIDRAPASLPVRAPAAVSGPEARAAEGEMRMRARRAGRSIEAETLMLVVERERAQRAHAEQRAAALERTLAERTDRWTRAYAEIDLIRDEIGELRRVFARIEAGAAQAPDPAGPVQPDRLGDALARLRERAEAAEAPTGEAPAGAAAPAGEPAAGGAAAPGPEPPAPPGPADAPEPLHVPPASSPRDRYTPLLGSTGASSVPPPGAGPASEPIPPAQSVQPAPAPARSVPPPAPAAAPAAGPWLWPIFRALTREDPVRAGQLLLHLLPAWHAVNPLPVACDLILGDRACVQVTMGAGKVEVVHAEAPRRPEDVHFQARGDLARLARTVAAGRLGRRVRRRMSRVSGDHEAFARLGLLVRASLSVGELHAAGVRLDPAFAFDLITRMIEPAWTVGERFTIAHRPDDATTADAHLDVRDGAPSSAAEGAPAGPADATVVCSTEAFLTALTRRPAREVSVEGRREPLARLVDWLERAQSG